MSDPSIQTENMSSTVVDDNMSVMGHDLSDTTVSTRTSASWHSVVSDAHLNSNLFVRSYSINTWLKNCFIEPDIRLTTAQEWKLRTCIRRLLSLSDIPLKISCIKRNELLTMTKENVSIPFIDQAQQSLSTTDASSQILIIQPCDKQRQRMNEQLGLYFHILSTSDVNNRLLNVKLFEFYSEGLKNKTIIPILLIKPPKLIFHIPSNTLKINLRSGNSLLELQLSTKENEPIRGYYYRWNETNSNEQMKFQITLEIDHSLMNQFNII
ncbi:unnamed protein product [Rotaria magnacalcarata]|uniref:Uncharacterized protein n=2 Tax=Rotaria magnacalcarata TaxID=392030 RepID=A0A816Y3N9_9BILA|nr:unnamed protein product [Rotaria magnacalcarata]CAF2154091.1 unnamed protein product [Rotaria magnacalcarata]